VVSGSVVYAAGSFTTLAGGATTRDRIAAIDATTGNATSWNPNANAGVTALAISISTKIVCAGGSFSVIANSPHSNIAAMSDPALPVELTSFLARVNGSGADLRWTTATETENYGFDVERELINEQTSANSSFFTTHSSSSNWTRVAFVEGAGSSNSPHEYSYRDENLHAGVYNYRLKQIDRDGKSAIHNLSG
jgi:hypothetical protein